MQAIVQEGLWLALVVSVVPMVMVAVGAGCVALLQAVTQIQEQSIVHLVRLVVLAGALLWGGSGAFAEVEGLLVRVIVAAGSHDLR